MVRAGKDLMPSCADLKQTLPSRACATLTFPLPAPPQAPWAAQPRETGCREVVSSHARVTRPAAGSPLLSQGRQHMCVPCLPPSSIFSRSSHVVDACLTVPAQFILLSRFLLEPTLRQCLLSCVH